VQDALEAGCDLVTFSGDKLLGGPQAGIVVGDAELVERIAQRPLARALRSDTLTLAALQATLAHYLLGEALDQIPVWQMISAEADTLRRRARRIARGVANASVAATESAVGGGSLPGQVLPSFAVRLAGGASGAAALAAQLRGADPPVIGRVQDDDVWLDVRTVLPRDERPLRQVLLQLPS
jgi:L-seryl-tRNA(Ser) seleniumtransferase